MTSPTDPNAKQVMPEWALPALSWLVSFYFLAGFSTNVGFPPERDLFAGDALFVALWLFFLFLPFFSKVKIGNLLELERKVEQAKEELREFKAEVRNNLAVLSTNVNTIGNITHQVTVNIPGVAELRESAKIVNERASAAARFEAEKIEERVLQWSEDTTLALARTRIELERLLRVIVGKPTDLPPSRTDFMSLHQLFNLFIQQHPEFAYLKQAFSDVVKVCNAAIHAQRITDAQAQEALGLGAKIIATLKALAAPSEGQGI